MALRGRDGRYSHIVMERVLGPSMNAPYFPEAKLRESAGAVGVTEGEGQVATTADDAGT